MSRSERLRHEPSGISLVTTMYATYMHKIELQNNTMAHARSELRPCVRTDPPELSLPVATRRAWLAIYNKDMRNCIPVHQRVSTSSQLHVGFAGPTHSAAEFTAPPCENAETH